MRHPVYVNRDSTGQTTVSIEQVVHVHADSQKTGKPWAALVCPGNDAVALRTGIGHGKVMGLGLLSVAPIA